jgi:RNA polymerase sigma factor (sigma-70 family)
MVATAYLRPYGAISHGGSHLQTSKQWLHIHAGASPFPYTAFLHHIKRLDLPLESHFHPFLSSFSLSSYNTTKTILENKIIFCLEIKLIIHYFDKSILFYMAIGERKLEKIWDKYYVRMMCFAKTYSDRDDVCQDIVVESFIKLWQEYDGKRNLEAFLVTIIKHKCVDYIRSARHVMVIGEEHIDDEMPDESSCFIEACVMDDIYKNIESFTERQRDIFYLYSQGVSTMDIAIRLRLSTQTVLNVKTVVITKLKKLFKQ